MPSGLSSACEPKNNEETPIGYEILESGEKVSLNAGDLSIIEVWEKYLDAHNDKDLKQIKSLVN